jgi:hypothetical protein
MPPRKLRWITRSELGQAKTAEPRHRSLDGLATRNAFYLQGKDRVLEHCPPGEKEVTLVHVGDPTESVRGGSSIEPDLSARRLLEAGDHVEKRALPASGRPDDADELTVGDA